MKTLIQNQSRRRFLQFGAGLTLAVRFAPLLAADEPAPAAPTPVPHDAFVRIAPDGTITVIAKHLEMGQGTFTGLATLVAEELDADWSKVQVEGAPADASRYGNLAWGGTVQGTGGSSAMAGAWTQMREAGATARLMLVQAAAKAWKVKPDSIQTRNSMLSHARSKRSAAFGEFAEAAALLPVPANVKLKKPSEYTLIGKEGLRRADRWAKTDGTAIFTQDVKLPDMHVAVVLHPPRFGGKPDTVDDTAAKAIKGVTAVLTVPGNAVFRGGVAVLARYTWSAMQGRDALKVSWDDSASSHVSSTQLLKDYRALADSPGKVAVESGEPSAEVFKAAARTVEAEYHVPYLAHASMEPLNCVVALSDSACEIWNGEQFHTIDQGSLAAASGLKPEQIKINQLYAGGSFGRRANPKSDYLLEALAIAQAARAAQIQGPIKMVWTREDDMHAGYFRPLTLHRIKAALDADGRVTGWWQRVVGQSIIKGSAFEPMMIKDGVDSTTMEGVTDLPYAMDSVYAELHSPEQSVPVQWWRSVGHTHTGFAVEAFVDELAHAAGKDPLDFRLGMLKKKDHPRHRAVLELVAQKSGWGKPLPARNEGERRGRGIALRKSFETHVAQVVEVSVQADGQFKVERVVCALDCGVAINPDVIRAQMEGGIGYGLSAALHGAITLEDGLIEQSNFHDYKVLRINEMPAVDVHIVASDESPTGVGEPGTAVIAPALVNALFAATGVRVRQLPIDPEILRAEAKPT